MPAEGTYSQKLQAAGKRPRGTQFRPWASPDVLGPLKPVPFDVVVAAVRSNTTVVRGELGLRSMDMMLDSGSSVSLIREDVLSQLSEVCSAPPRELRLVTAAGEAITVAGYVSVPVQLGQVRVMHPFVVVKSLIAGVILGIDFLQQHGLVLDFAHSPIKVLPHCPENENCHENAICVPPDMQGIAKEATKARDELGAIMSIGESPEDVVNDCAIPRLDKTKAISFESPSCSSVDVTSLMNEFKELFQTTPGTTTVTQHFIPTLGPPVKIPPRRVPANYQKAVEEQLQSMLNAGIIEESSSPWMAPAVYVPKTSGEIRICIDFRELNKNTIKDAYPLPRPDEVPDKLQGSAVFSIPTYRVGVGSCQCILQTDPRLHSVLDQVWDCFNSLECHLDFPMHRDHFNG